MSRTKKNSMDWLEGFGSSKNHDIFFVKSAEEPLMMAHTLERLFHHHFRYLGSCALIQEYPQIGLPLYFSTLNFGHEANIVLLPNSITIPAQELESPSDPLLNGFLFDEEYFFFNKQEKTLFKSSFVCYDYMLLLSSNKNFHTTYEVVDILMSVPSFRTIQKSELLEHGGNRIEKKQVDFLQTLFVNMEIRIKAFMEDEIRRSLHGNTVISPENYTSRRYLFEQTSLLNLMGNVVAQREDI